MDSWNVVAASKVLAPQAGKVTTLACTTTTASKDLTADTNLYARPQDADEAGEVILTIQNTGTVDMGILFGPASGVIANTAATTGNTQCAVLAAGQERSYNVNPGKNEKYLSARTVSSTATLTMWLSSQTKNMLKPSGG